MTDLADYPELAALRSTDPAQFEERQRRAKRIADRLDEAVRVVEEEEEGGMRHDQHSR